MVRIYVDKAAFQRWRTKAEGSKVKVGQDCFNDDLASLPPFGAGFPVRVRLEQFAFLWMIVPRLCAFSGKREYTGQSAFTLSDGLDRGKAWILRGMSATVPGHISTPRG